LSQVGARHRAGAVRAGRQRHAGQLTGAANEGPVSSAGSVVINSGIDHDDPSSSGPIILEEGEDDRGDQVLHRLILWR
jgi:hypothetical protein